MSDSRKDEEPLSVDEEGYCSSSDEAGNESFSHSVDEIDEDFASCDKEEDLEEYTKVMKLIEGGGIRNVSCISSKYTGCVTSL